MDNGNNQHMSTAAKTIIIVFLIIIAIIAHFCIEINNFMNREYEIAMATASTEETARPLDTAGWNYVDEDTMKYMRERDATATTTTTGYYESVYEAAKEELIMSLMDDKKSGN